MEDFKVKIEIVEDTIKLEPLEPGQDTNDKNSDHLESKTLVFEIEKDVKSEALECANYTGSDSNLDPPKTRAIPEELSNKDAENKGLKFEETLEFQVKDENELRLEDAELIIKEEIDETELETYGSPETQRRKNQPEKIYMCYHCNFETEVKVHLKTHMLMGIHKDDIAMIKCHHCSYQNKIRKNLNHHIRQRHGAASLNTSVQVKTFICDRCDFQTTRRKYLTKHSIVHMDESEVKFYFCASCSFRTRYQNALCKHILYKHTDDSAKYKCESCPFQTKKIESMKDHVLKCNGMQRFKCNWCEYQTKRKRNLKIHLNHHRSEVAMFSCEYCFFRSRYRASLSHHILNIHTDEAAKYRCDRCRYQTTKREYLMRHLLKCNGAPDSFKCNRCHFQTKYKSNLKKHALIHMDERRVEMFSCQYCSFRSRRKDHVAKHTKLKHTGNALEYKCYNCDFQTKKEDMLIDHMHKHSKDK